LGTRAGFLASSKPALSANLHLGTLLRAGGIWRGVAPAELSNVFDRVVAALPGMTPPIRQLLSQRLRAAGGVTWAPIGGGYALPHPSARITLGRESGTVALVLLRDPLPTGESAPDDIPVTRLFFFIAPSPRAHLDLLARLSRGLAGGTVRQMVEQGAGDEEIFRAFDATDIPTEAKS
jgi:PTS system nitrogen regulatory IIA component